VERVRLADGTNVIVKLARPPFEQEARILLALGELGLPVPVVLRAGHCGPRGELVMVLEDLGLPIREATLAEGAEAARLLHGASAPAWLPVLGEGQLTELPARSLAHLAVLVESGRWSDCDELARLLHAAQTVAERRVEGVRRAPFGLCHSEFHPTSLHVGKSGWTLLDWARAFRGPGLIDLASWRGTQVPPSPDACRTLIEAYVAAGGTPEAAVSRAGLPSERWALGWHRLWVVEWYLQQSVALDADAEEDRLYEEVVGRHLDEALSLLEG
jgi:hypothetical protein